MRGPRAPKRGILKTPRSLRGSDDAKRGPEAPKRGILENIGFYEVLTMRSEAKAPTGPAGSEDPLGSHIYIEYMYIYTYNLIYIYIYTEGMP